MSIEITVPDIGADEVEVGSNEDRVNVVLSSFSDAFEVEVVDEKLSWPFSSWM